MKRTMTNVRFVWTVSAAGMLLVLMVLLATLYESKRDNNAEAPPPLVHDRSPAFNLPSVRHGQVNAKQLQGRPILVSFLYLPKDETKRESLESRSQMNFDKSMWKQYYSLGLQVVVVDASGLVNGKETDGELQTNFTYDWTLDRIPLLRDDRLRMTKSYGVSRLPATFLISGAEIIAQRWDGMVLTGQMSQAIEALLNGADTLRVTPALSPFPGLPLARPLSDSIWMIDGGQSWRAHQPLSVRWAVIAPGTMRIRVTLEKEGEGTLLDVADEPVEPVSREEENVLLRNDARKEKVVGFATSSVVVNEPGVYRVKAIVTRAQADEPPLLGEAVIQVK